MTAMTTMIATPRQPRVDRRAFLAGAASLTTASLASVTGARAAWPERAITVIVPYAAGATGTVVMRLIGDLMAARLGKPIIVEPRPGAGGNIGAGVVAAAEPDGHTLLVGATNNFVINQFMFANMRFDPQTAFAPVTRIVDGPLVFFAHSSVPAKTLPEFVAWAKANPGKATFASPGVGTSPHLASERLKQIAGLDMVHLPFNGSPPAMQALLAGQVQLYLAAYAVAAGHLETGAVVPLAAVTRKRIKQLPQTPTAIESGYADFVASNWWGMAAPKGTPRPIIEALRDAVAQAMTDPKVIERCDQLGMEPVADAPDAFAATIAAEAKLFEDIVRRAGLTPQRP